MCNIVFAHARCCFWVSAYAHNRPYAWTQIFLHCTSASVFAHARWHFGICIRAHAYARSRVFLRLHPCPRICECFCTCVLLFLHMRAVISQVFFCIALALMFLRMRAGVFAYAPAAPTHRRGCICFSTCALSFFRIAQTFLSIRTVVDVFVHRRIYASVMACV